MVSGAGLLQGVGVISRTASVSARLLGRPHESHESHSPPSPRGGCTRSGESLGHPTPPRELPRLFGPAGPVPSGPGRPLGGTGPRSRGGVLIARPKGGFSLLPFKTDPKPPRRRCSRGKPHTSRRLKGARGRPRRTPARALCARAARPGDPEADRWDARVGAMTAGCARRFPHLRKRVHRSGLRVSIARRRKRWLESRKKNEVSRGSARRWEKSRSPGQGDAPDLPSRSPRPPVSGSASGGRSNLNFSAGSRAHAREAGRAAPRPRAGSRGPAQPGGSHGRPRPPLQATASPGTWREALCWRPEAPPNIASPREV